MGSTSNHNLTTFDPTVDGAKKFKEYIEKDSKENMVIIDTELKNLQDQIDNKVTIDEVSQSNFNFNAREVVPDGLVDINTIVKSNDSFTMSLNDTSVIGGSRAIWSLRDTSKSLGYSLDASSAGDLRLQYYDADNISRTILLGRRLANGEKTNITTIFDTNTFVFIINNEEFYTCVLPNNNIISKQFGIGINNEFLYLYNRPLTPQEVAHNFQVLNNSPSLISLNDYAFASDSEHVTMRNGFSVEEAYTSLLKQFAREFTSDGSPIIINNGL